MTTNTSDLTLKQIVELFSMEPHRTAGWYALHYSDSELRGRPRLSSIYFVLPGGEPVPLHRTDAIEIWHYYAGAPAEFTVAAGASSITTQLGADFCAGQRPQLAIPAHCWQSARSLGDWTLLGCTMSPGYASGRATVLSVED